MSELPWVIELAEKYVLLSKVVVPDGTPCDTIVWKNVVIESGPEQQFDRVDTVCVPCNQPADHFGPMQTPHCSIHNYTNETPEEGIEL